MPDEPRPPGGWTERLVGNRERALEQRLGFGGAILPAVERGEVVQRLRDVRMVGTDRFLRKGERPLEQRLGFVIAMLIAIHIGQVAQRDREVRMVGTVRLLLEWRATA